MAKKITFTLLVGLLIASALVFVSCKQDPGSQPGPAPSPDPELTPVVNKLGEVGGNLVYGGDLEGEDTDLQGDGATVEIMEQVGVDGSRALYVEQTENYGEVLMDLTDYYGRGKSYYVEASFKNAGVEGARTDDLNAKIDFSVVAGQGYASTGRDYDVPGQYEGGWMDDDSAAEIFGFETEGAQGTDLSDGEWVTISAVLDAEQIEELLVNQTKLCGGGDVTLYKLAVVFYVGTYSDGDGQTGYKYYLDNVVIKDLNKEIKKTGRTYKAPDTGEEEEEEEEELGFLL